MASQVAADRMNAAVPAETTGKIVGAGISSVATNTLDFAENLHNVTFSNCKISDVTVHAEGCAWYYANQNGGQVTNCAIFNDTGNALSNGMWLDDSNGLIQGFQFRGVNYCFRTRNFGLVGEISDVYAEGNAGIALSHSIIFQFDHSYSATRLRVRNVRQSNYAGKVRFGGSFADYTIEFRDCSFEQPFAYGIIARNDGATSFVVGDLVEFDPASAAGTRKVVTAAVVPNQRCGSVVVGANTDFGVGFLVVAPLPAPGNTPVTVNGAVAVGDLIEAAANRQGVVNNAPANPLNIVGRSTNTKAAGVGLVTVGSR